MRGGVGEPVDQAEHRPAGQHGAQRVQPLAAAGRLPHQQRGGAGQRGPGEEQVHVQRPPPGQVLGQHAAQQQAHRAAGRSDRAEHGERLSAVPGIGERVGQDRQRRRRHDRREGTLAGTRRHQHGKVNGRPAHGGRDGEAGQAGHERDLAAEQVGQPPAGQQQAAERQRVRRHHPLPVHGDEVQRPLRGRQRDVHYRQVEDDHELGDGDRRQDQPAPARVLHVLHCLHSGVHCRHPFE